MAKTPMDIRQRPFSVEPLTNIMLPDGIFDTAIFTQHITCNYTNTSDQDLHDVSIYLESAGDPGIVPVARTFTFPKIRAGASVRVFWPADFRNATPGKKLVSFIAKAQGLDSKRVIKQIFISKTTYDETSKEYSCEVEEGTLKVSYMSVIGPRNEWHNGHAHDCCCCCCKPSGGKPSGGGTGPWIPKKMNMAFYPNPGYEGIHGDLPFSDPWWKILAWIVAIVAAIVAIIAAAVGAGQAYVGVGGTFDETEPSVSCCEPDVAGVAGETEFTVAGVASIIATVAVAVGLSDAEDPWWRGQKATPPAKGEITHVEKVDVEFDYPGGAPNAGVAYPVDVKWTYQRVTNLNSYSHSVEEQQVNIHVSDGVEVITPDTHNAFEKPLVVKAKFQKTEGKYYLGPDLYAFALLQSPDGLYFRMDLLDDGIDFDEDPDDGTYTGSINMKSLYRVLLKRNLKLEGVWKVFVFAQDINDATPDMLPEVAATHIGGFMVASAIHLTFDPSLPCPLKAQASINVVT
ncbi:MAG: hypothetical protein GY820_07695 [Gammaproteobacteria bacterium]|nr:hypothetical protein [Gammaproteobacteria bacterium]